MNRTTVVTALLLASAPAFAHPGHVEHAGFVAGLAHPFGGIDHLLALLAVGIWSARQRSSTLPAVFLAMLGAGALAGTVGVRRPALEGGIALTVLLAGLLAAGTVRLPVLMAGTIAGAFALWHGNAHGLEIAGWKGAAGFLLASAALLAAGGMLARLPLARAMGAAIAAAGLALLAL